MTPTPTPTPTATMTLQEAMQNRHAVRSYLEKDIEPEILTALTAEIATCNAESGLNIQLVTHEPRAFSGIMARLSLSGRFSGINTYLALIGKPGPDFEEKIGYFGQRVVLKAQQLGLNSCWVAVSYSKGRCGAAIGPEEKLGCVIPLGYGVTQGVPHKSRPFETLCRMESDGEGDMPAWFRKGGEAALLAPTANNQQKFLFTLTKEGVQAQAIGRGSYTQIDLGIAKYHFEVGAGKENFRWTSGHNL
ncbi:MAG: nitroreductase [Peptococcaceae bacterium]|nr:nitroreductase [Peptococcaceae bacterium]